MMPSTLLLVDELSLASILEPIVENLSFEIKRGEIIALTGRSGSGKTSIALAILGSLPPGVIHKKGSIQFTKENGTRISLPPDALSWTQLRGSDIGYIQQDVFGAFDPVIKMGKQMLMIIRERSTHVKADPEGELESTMDEVGIHDIHRLLNSYPHQLSGGQLQRCLLCVSIMIRPSLLIADEPTSAIDRINQVELLDLFAHMRRKYGMAILCITHERSVVRYLADREISLEEHTDEKHEGSPNLIMHTLNNKSILEVKGLGYLHKFGGLLEQKGARVKDISFLLKEGQCLGVIGESGSGKSTLAQMLVGLLIPSNGEVIVCGLKINFQSRQDVRMLRSKIQLVMQDGKGSLHPHKSVSQLYNEIIDQKRKKGMEENKILSDILKEVDLPANVLDRSAGNLSGGECLRVSIARALLMDPDIIICDESTSALDESGRDAIMDLLRTLMQKRKLGLILISHDENLIRKMSDDVMVLADGRMVEYGPLHELLDHPRHEITQKIFAADATLSRKKNL